MARTFGYKHISATGTDQTIDANPGNLGTVTVNTGATGAILTLYDGAASAAQVIAVIDAASKSSAAYIVHYNTSLHYTLATGNADITVGFGNV